MITILHKFERVYILNVDMYFLNILFLWFCKKKFHNIVWKIHFYKKNLFIFMIFLVFSDQIYFRFQSTKHILIFLCAYSYRINFSSWNFPSCLYPFPQKTFSSRSLSLVSSSPFSIPSSFKSLTTLFFHFCLGWPTLAFLCLVFNL